MVSEILANRISPIVLMPKALNVSVCFSFATISLPFLCAAHAFFVVQ